MIYLFISNNNHTIQQNHLLIVIKQQTHQSHLLLMTPPDDGNLGANINCLNSVTLHLYYWVIKLYYIFQAIMLRKKDLITFEENNMHVKFFNKLILCLLVSTVNQLL